MRHSFPCFFIVIAVLCVPLAAEAQDAKAINYDEHVAAIFKRHCLQCHGESKQEAGLNLISFASVIKGGSGGEVVVAGRSSASLLFNAITAEDPAERMPPENDPLPAEQIAMMKAWIDNGLRENAGSEVAAPRTMKFTPSKVAELDGPPVLPTDLPVFKRTETTRPFPILALASSPRAPLLAVASYECIDFVNPVSQDVIGSVPFPEGEPHVLKFNQSGALLLAAGGLPVQNGKAVLFDVSSGKRLAEIGDETDVVIAADVAADERFVSIGGAGRTVKVFSTQDGSLVHTLVKHTDWITAIAYSPDGKLLATGDRAGNIHLWDTITGGTVLPLAEHKGSITSLGWRSDSMVLASCGEDGLIVWWDVSKGWPANSKAGAHVPQRPAGVYGNLAGGVLHGAFGPDGELLTCGRDQTAKLWSSEGNLLATFPLKPARDVAPTGVPILPLQTALTFDGMIAVVGDSAGHSHFFPVKPTK